MLVIKISTAHAQRWGIIQAALKAVTDRSWASLGWANAITLCFLFALSIVGAQAEPILQPGDAVVTGFSGVKAAEGQTGNTSDTLGQYFIDRDGPSAQIFPLATVGGKAKGQLLTPQPRFSAIARDVGQIFGIAFDDGKDTGTPNIYLAASSVYGIQIVGPGDKPSRLKQGHQGATWMAGQFGDPAKGGGPGSIWKVDGTTGEISLFANIPNSGPGLGNIVFDKDHRQFFVSDLDAGVILRLDINGKILQAFDHGMIALPVAGQSAIADDGRVMNIQDASFESENTDTWGITQPERRVWGLAVYNGRLYYSVWAGPQVWSVGLNSDGSFASDPGYELTLEDGHGATPISDMAFDSGGTLYLAQRGGIKSPHDYSVFADAGLSRVLRYQWSQTASKNGSWVRADYAVGFPAGHRNASGGVTLSYGYDERGEANRNRCEDTLWSTGDALRTGLESNKNAENAETINGLQGNPIALLLPANQPPVEAYYVDYDGLYDDAGAEGHIGVVKAYAPCGAPRRTVASNQTAQTQRQASSSSSPTSSGNDSGNASPSVTSDNNTPSQDRGTGQGGPQSATLGGTQTNGGPQGNITITCAPGQSAVQVFGGRIVQCHNGTATVPSSQTPPGTQTTGGPPAPPGIPGSGSITCQPGQTSVQAFGGKIVPCQNGKATFPVSSQTCPNGGTWPNCNPPPLTVTTTGSPITQGPPPELVISPIYCQPGKSYLTAGGKLVPCSTLPPQNVAPTDQGPPPSTAQCSVQCTQQLGRHKCPLGYVGGVDIGGFGPYTTCCPSSCDTPPPVPTQSPNGVCPYPQQALFQGNTLFCVCPAGLQYPSCTRCENGADDPPLCSNTPGQETFKRDLILPVPPNTHNRRGSSWQGPNNPQVLDPGTIGTVRSPVIGSPTPCVGRSCLQGLGSNPGGQPGGGGPSSIGSGPPKVTSASPNWGGPGGGGPGSIGSGPPKVTSASPNWGGPGGVGPGAGTGGNPQGSGVGTTGCNGENQTCLSQNKSGGLPASGSGVPPGRTPVNPAGFGNKTASNTPSGFGVNTNSGAASNIPPASGSGIPPGQNPVGTGSKTATNTPSGFSMNTKGGVTSPASGAGIPPGQSPGNPSGPVNKTASNTPGGYGVNTRSYTAPASGSGIPPGQNPTNRGISSTTTAFNRPAGLGTGAQPGATPYTPSAGTINSAGRNQSAGGCQGAVVAGRCSTSPPARSNVASYNTRSQPLGRQSWPQAVHRPNLTPQRQFFARRAAAQRNVRHFQAYRQRQFVQRRQSFSRGGGRSFGRRR